MPNEDSTDPQEGLLHRPVDSPATLTGIQSRDYTILGKENIRQRHYPQAKKS